MRRNGKYNARRTEFNGKVYDSKKEAETAAKLQALERAGNIRCLREQVPYVIAEGRGKEKAVIYKADFTYIENDTNRFRVIDVKGFRTAEYRLKKRLLSLLLNVKVEEI